MKKSLKKQAVFPVLMLLVVTALALIGSSFAWFSMSSTAKVTNVTGQIEDSSIGLMISQNALDFKASIQLDSTAATYVNPYRFHQMSSTNGVNFFEAEIIKKAANGTATEIYSTASDNEPVAGTGNDLGKLFGWITDGAATSPQTQNLTSGSQSGTISSTTYYNQAGYMVFDLFFQVEKASTLYLNAGTNFDANTTNVTGATNNAMRVAFLSMGGVETGEKTATQLQSDAIKLNSVVENGTTIWNPTAASDAAADYYGVKKAEGTATAGFAPYALASNVTEQVDAKSSNELYSDTPFDTNSTMTGYTSLANLVAGVNKVRVVVWLEGNDESCTVKIANLSILMNLSFFAKAN